MTLENNEPIFIHSLFRSGSTYVYNAIKRTERFYIYHEPFHEVIANLPTEWADFANRTSQLKDLLRHDFLSGGYFDEYAPLLEEIKQNFSPDFSYKYYFLDEQDDAPPLKSYLDGLMKGSPRKPVFQCTRTSGRISWIKKNYPSKHIFLARNPWDQWFSYKVDAYISQTPQIIYSQPRLPKVLQAIMEVNGFRPLAGNDLLEMRSYCATHPVMPAVDYSLFFGLWLFAFVCAHKDCELFLDMDEVSRGSAEQSKAESDLARLGLDGVNLQDCNLHRTLFKSKEIGFYQTIESHVLDIFKQNGGFENWLPLAEKYLESERANSFTDNLSAGVDPKNIFEDAARLRTNLISSGKDEAHLAGLLNEEVTSLASQISHEIKEREELAAKLIDEQNEREALAVRLTREQEEMQSLVFQKTNTEQKLRFVTSQLDEITNSKFWKLGLRFRRIKDLIAPPNSVRDRIGRWVLSTILFASKISKSRRLKADFDLIASSGLFNSSWYLTNNRDVAAANVDPLRHYLERGAFEGRDPGPDFSSHWYLRNNPDVARSGVNPLVHYLQHGMKEGRQPAPVIENELKPRREVVDDVFPKDQFAVFTIGSRNFTAYAKTLFESVNQYHPGAEMFMVLCDTVDSDYLRETFPFKIITLSDLAIPEVEEMAQRYNITEFNTAVKPYAFSYLFKKLGKEKIIYLDPDIILLSPLEEVLDEFSKGAECILTPHILEPAEHVEMSDIKMLQFGIYNLGFLALRKTPDVLRIVDWWSRQLVDKCVINLAEGLFVDQKWADLFLAFIKRVAVLHHPGYNVAYWNLSQRTVEIIDGKWYSNRQPLRFVHFSGNKLDDPYFLSRHSGVFTRDNIGDLNYLLKMYRERLFTNGHATYSKIPYSFNWNGASGINLHTPKPIETVSMDTDKINTGVQTEPGNRVVKRLLSYWKLLRTAHTFSGGWLALTKKVIRAFRQGGIAAIRHRAYFVNNYAERTSTFPRKTPFNHQENSIVMGWMSRILVIDSSTPRPDRDAGSLSTFNLLKIYLDLGYDVTFIPSDLLYLGEYTEALHALGIRCLQRPEISSVQEHLEKEGDRYEFVILCRAPIAALYIADLRRCAPSAKIILDTIDLHYLREEREAKLNGSSQKIKAAEDAKNWELEIIRRCDVTIVLSSVEDEILKKELTNVDVRLIPLIFVDNVYEIPGFEERKDFLFIGGFPHMPNVDAVIYFCNDVLPLIRQKLPDVIFHIIGNAPPPQVTDLANHKGVIVHGYVQDIMPIFRTCRLSVAPLRFGAGIKGKIATSLANGVPVIATSLAVEGMEIEVDKHVLVADDPKQFADKFVEAYESKDLWNRLSESGRYQALRVYSATAGYQRISKLMKDINPRHHQIDLYSLRSFQEYDLLRRTIAEEIKGRKTIELNLIKHDQTSFFTPGFCAICGNESMFNTSFMYSYETTKDGKMIPNWREHLDCIRCGFTNRIRAAMHIFYQRLKPARDASIYITEQTTPLFKWLQQRHTRLVGSEYFGDAVPFGTEKDGLRNEDLTALTFPDNSFDFILSFDVMEHVSDDIAALKEVYRCLKPGGIFLFTAPFLQERTEKVIRAQLHQDGSIEHILSPEYHGNPVDQEHGALCFRYFAWDLIEDMKQIGFMDSYILNYWSYDFAYLGGEQFIFIGIKGTH